MSLMLRTWCQQSLKQQCCKPVRWWRTLVICTLSLFAFFDHFVRMTLYIIHVCIKLMCSYSQNEGNHESWTHCSYHIHCNIYNVIDVDNLGRSLLIVSNTNSYTFTKQLWCMLHSRIYSYITQWWLMWLQQFTPTNNTKILVVWQFMDDSQEK